MLSNTQGEFWNHDIMDDTSCDHVVWQASQTGCEALNRLMYESIGHKKSLKSDNESLLSPGSAASDESSSTPPLMSLRTRRSKRRSSTKYSSDDNRVPLTEPSKDCKFQSSSTAPDPATLLTFIKEVSLKVDEGSRVKRKAIENLQFKTKPKRLVQEKGSNLQGTTWSKEQNWRCSSANTADAKLKAEASIQFQSRKRLAYGEGSLANTDRDKLRMPPPPSSPMRRIHSLDSTLSIGNPSTGSKEIFIGSSREQISLQASSSLHRTGFTSTSPEYTSFASSSCCTTPSLLQKPLSANDLESPPLSALSSSAPLTLKTVDRLPGYPQTQLQIGVGIKPKLPILGMRRKGSGSKSQRPFINDKEPVSGAQIVRGQFKTPFAKRQSYAPSTSEIAADQQIQYQSHNATCIEQRPIAQSEIGGDDPGSNCARGQSRLSAQCLDPVSPIRNQSKNLSSSSGADANDSFGSSDFDMGIDLEELEKTCSMYD